MTIIYSEKFYDDFTEIYDFISLDSHTRANNFTAQLQDKISYLVDYPYKFRKSNYFSDSNTRDYIFKGYVIPYHVNTEENVITVLGIVKYKKSL